MAAGFEITTRDFISIGGSDLGYGGHAGAANAHEMDVHTAIVALVG